MAAYQGVFERYEKKYLISKGQLNLLLPEFQMHLQTDQYGRHTICNIYLDTEDYQLIRTSLEKPVYKEKLRLRSYGTPGSQDMVFLELKKKFKGVVYKRRISMTLLDARRYLTSGAFPDGSEQILQEISWFLKFYQPVPKAYIAYDRTALYGVEDEDLRITFDENIRGRSNLLDLTRGSWGSPLLRPDTLLMEIKLPGVMPLWLSHLLSRESIFPTSFSKYGSYYQQFLAQSPATEGGRMHA